MPCRQDLIRRKSSFRHSPLPTNNNDRRLYQPTHQTPPRRPRDGSMRSLQEAESKMRRRTYFQCLLLRNFAQLSGLPSDQDRSKFRRDSNRHELIIDRLIHARIAHVRIARERARLLQRKSAGTRFPLGIHRTIAGLKSEVLREVGHIAKAVRRIYRKI